MGGILSKKGESRLVVNLYFLRTYGMLTTIIMKRIIQFHIYQGDKLFVAEGVDVPVITQGKTLDELTANVQEAVALHLEGENLAELDIAPQPSVLLNMELPTPAYV